MATRKIIDAEHGGEKVWIKGHAKAIFMSNGSTVEDTINNIQTGGITTETDPIFLASPAAGITDLNISSWNGKQENISDIETIRQGAAKGLTAIQPSDLSSVATSGDYNDLTNKPAIPSTVTESTVSGWGFTKNAGTYSKPSDGIPKTDLANDIQTSLEKADTALQSFTETDPVFIASPAHAITANDISAWNDKMDETPIFNHGTDDTTCSIAPNVFHLWGEVASLNITLTTPDDPTILNEYMLQFTSGTTATVLSLPSDIVWISEPTIEASKTYQISIVNNLAVIGGF